MKGIVHKCGNSSKNSQVVVSLISRHSSAASGEIRIFPPIRMMHGALPADSRRKNSPSGILLARQKSFTDSSPWSLEDDTLCLRKIGFCWVSHTTQGAVMG